ncbi:hypothetical protein QCA50_008554 [Cerrena zonata]|uniref:Uncharacterized protein n=1 Tax=Cerrena zonata TaxID=2478898 RepID=A0AAW0FSL9_9APHY
MYLHFPTLSETPSPPSLYHVQIPLLTLSHRIFGIEQLPDLVRSHWGFGPPPRALTTAFLD